MLECPWRLIILPGRLHPAQPSPSPWPFQLENLLVSVRTGRLKKQQIPEGEGEGTGAGAGAGGMPGKAGPLQSRCSEKREPETFKPWAGSLWHSALSLLSLVGLVIKSGEGSCFPVPCNRGNRQFHRGAFPRTSGRPRDRQKPDLLLTYNF